jgi:hypothetical protein
MFLAFWSANWRKGVPRWQGGGVNPGQMRTGKWIARRIDTNTLLGTSGRSSAGSLANRLANGWVVPNSLVLHVFHSITPIRWPVGHSQRESNSRHLVHCSTAHAVEQWMTCHNGLAYHVLHRAFSIHRSTAQTVWGGFPFFLRPAEGAPTTADLYIIPFEHSDPWIGQ